jgi:hypothetical protein
VETQDVSHEEVCNISCRRAAFALGGDWENELRFYRVVIEDRTVSSSDIEAILDAEQKSGGAIECHRAD